MWMERSVIVGCVKREMEHLRLGDGWIVGDVNMEGGYRGCVSWFCLPLWNNSKCFISKSWVTKSLCQFTHKARHPLSASFPLLPSPSVFSLSCLWHLHVKRQQKSCFNLYPWLIVCAQRMVAPFPPFTFSNPLLVFPVNTDCIWITSQIGLD